MHRLRQAIQSRKKPGVEAFKTRGFTKFTMTSRGTCIRTISGLNLKLTAKNLPYLDLTEILCNEFFIVQTRLKSLASSNYPGRLKTSHEKAIKSNALYIVKFPLPLWDRV